jgi:hypothetical protein
MGTKPLDAMLTITTLRTPTRIAATLALAMAGLGAHADNLNPVLGGGLGAITGAFIGQSVGGRDGAVIGAAVGGATGVVIASNGERRHQPPPTVVYTEPPRPVPVYGYRVVERVNYYPVPAYGPRGWGEHRYWHEEHRWDHRDWDHRGGEHRGWDRHD